MLTPSPISGTGLRWAALLKSLTAILGSVNRVRSAMRRSAALVKIG
jgi:hypothetical protein